MSAAAPLQTQASKSRLQGNSTQSNSTHAGLLLQRKCACGSPTTSLTGECAECKSKKRLQAKLSIGASNDPLEQEADRIADQVLAAPADPAVSGAPPHIQRFTGQATGQADTAPASVDRVLTSPGSPLEPVLRQDMEQRFGHDFSRVRVHPSGAAEQSARDVNANAYTVGQNIVFGAGRFAPGTNEGRRLIAHELTHVVQQSGSAGVRFDQGDDRPRLSPIPVALQKQPTFTPTFGAVKRVREQLQRRSDQQSGPREATIDIRWPDRATEFYDRVVDALVRSRGFRGFDASDFRSTTFGHTTSDTDFDVFSEVVEDFFIRSRLKEGQRVKLHVSADYDPDPGGRIPSLTHVKISIDEKPAVVKAGREAPAPSTPTASAQQAPPRTNEPDEEVIGVVTWSGGNVSVGNWYDPKTGDFYDPKTGVPDNETIFQLIRVNVISRHPYDGEPADVTHFTTFVRTPGERWSLAYDWPWQERQEEVPAGETADTMEECDESDSNYVQCLKEQKSAIAQSALEAGGEAARGFAALVFPVTSALIGPEAESGGDYGALAHVPRVGPIISTAFRTAKAAKAAKAASQALKLPTYKALRAAADIDKKLLELALYNRTALVEQGMHFGTHNIAVIKVLIDGKPAVMSARNTVHELHSEARLIKQIDDMIANLKKVEVKQIYSERIPCTKKGCMQAINARFPKADVFFSVSEDLVATTGSTAEALKVVYGLKP